MSAQLSPEEVVRKYSTADTEADPRISTTSSRPTTTPTMATRHRGVDPGGARDDYEYSVKQADRVIRYAVDALVVGSDMVGAAWTGTLPSGYEAKGHIPVR